MMRVDDWLTRLQHPGVIDLGLDRIRSVAQKLGLNKIAPKIITVAGTNGKGSCCAVIDSVARAHGLRTAVYSSPHITQFNERLHINGQKVRDDPLLKAFSEVAHFQERTALTYFEFTTLAIFKIIAESDVDLAILEVGLGGRLDAVNIIDADCAVVTSIAKDHEAFLGETFKEIFREKLGVARTNKPLVIGSGIALNVDESLQCRPNVCFINSLNTGYCASKTQRPVQKIPLLTKWHYQDDHTHFENLPVPALSGAHQLANAACALSSLSHLYTLNRAATINGLKQVRLNGRLQTLNIEKKTLLVDVAHNPQAVEELVRHVKEQYSVIDVIFSSFKDKDIRESVLKIKPIVQHWYLYPLDDVASDFRGADLSMLRDTLVGIGVDASQMTLGKNIEELWFNATKREGTSPLVAFGSFMVVADALALQQNIGKNN